MAQHLTVILDDPDGTAAADFDPKLDMSSKGRHEALRAVMNILQGLAGGQRRARLRVQVSTVAANQTITCAVASVTVGTTTLTVGPTTFSVVTTASTSAQITAGASNAAFATNTATAINANATTSKIVYASASSNVVTVTCRVPGIIGNHIPLAEAGAAYTLGAATLASGAGNDMDAYSFGVTTPEADGNT